MKKYFIEQADYQHWASTELFRCLDVLSEEQRNADVGLFFKDIHKTVDHILIVTRNWRARLAGEFDKVLGQRKRQDDADNHRQTEGNNDQPAAF